MISRAELTSRILDAKRAKEPHVRVSGQSDQSTPGLDGGRAATARPLAPPKKPAPCSTLLGLDDELAPILQEPPLKGSLEQQVPVDPLIYRFHEITQVYGTAIKAVIHELFGDGIMSAIDFEIDIQKKSDPKGDRVVVTYNGKFLPYRKW